MRIREILAQKSKVSRADREWLLCSLYVCKKSELYLANFEISPIAMRKYSRWLKKRERGVPLQYIVGSAPFYGREFIVNPKVLIPRPETEQLVSLAISLGDELAGGKNLRILDLGTGSGVIALTIKAERAHWSVGASDISAPALKIAKKNAEQLGLDISFYTSDLCKKIPKDIELLVSNPPYLNPNKDKVAKEVLKHEPRLALFPSKKYKNNIADQGVWIADQILAQALCDLPRLQRIILELSPRGASLLEQKWKKHLRVKRIWHETDLTGRKRFLLLALR